ncbi:42348_t:CDS:2, partial [Gigaspora margarita]
VSAPSRYNPPQPFNQNVQSQNHKNQKTPSTPLTIRGKFENAYQRNRCAPDAEETGTHITIDEALDTLYVFERSSDPMPSQDCISKNELDHLIDGYLEALDNFMFELQKGQETEDGNKECEVLVYYQKPVEPNQHEARTFGSHHRNGVEINEVETIVDHANSRLPELEFDDLVLDLIDEYLVEESIKTNNASGCQYANSIAVARNNDKELEAEVGYEGRVKADKNENKPSEIESKDKIDVNNDITKSEKENDINGSGVGSQALPYHQKPVEAAETSTVNGTIEPSFKRRVEMEKGFPVDHRKTAKMDDITKTKLDELQQKEKMKIENVPEDVEGKNPRSATEEEAKENEIIKSEEILNRACEIWISKIDESRRLTREVDDCGETKLDQKYEKDSNGLYNLKLCSQNGASAIKEERVAFDLDPIEDICSGAEDFEDLSDNYPPSKNMNIRTNSARQVLRGKIGNNSTRRGQIKRISLEKGVGNNVEKNVSND